MNELGPSVTMAGPLPFDASKFDLETTSKERRIAELKAARDRVEGERGSASWTTVWR